MASKKVSTLNALTSAGDDDLLYIADTSDSGASYASKRITVQNFLNGTASADGLATEISDRTSGDTALSNRLDVLEADPTTATDVADAIAVETAARQAADALALPLTGGTMTGDIELGSGGGGAATATISVQSVVDFGPNYENIVVSMTRSGSAGTFFAGDDTDASGGSWGTFMATIDGVNINENTMTSGDAFTPGKRWFAFGHGAGNAGTLTINSTESFTSYSKAGYSYNTPVVHGGGGGGSATTIGVDGSASFGGTISASTAPTDDDHLVNKLYADNLVAGVDLSGIATNTAAIAAETTARTNADNTLSGRLDTLEADPTTQTLLDAETAARQAADALKLDLAGGTVTGNITASAAPTADGHLVNKLYADNLVAGVDLTGIATNAQAIAALSNGAPELLNTITELADALGDDENFATTVTNQISAESTARSNADTALSGRLDTLEADPTTGTALSTEASARASADSALSGRLDTLEADPTTATAVTAAIATETAARQAADDLKLDLAGGTMSGDIVMGSGVTSTDYTAVRNSTGGPEWLSVFTGEGNLTQITFTKPNFVVHVYAIEVDGALVTSGTVTLDSGDWYSDSYTGANVIDGDTSTRAFGGPHGSVITFVPDAPISVTSEVRVLVNGANTTQHLNDGKVSTVVATIASGSGSGSSTISADGSATFSGLVSASAVPSDDAHLVNKLYADSLVAGVDLSGIATNAAAISAETTARTNADTALSGRLDTLEADPTTGAALTAETNARTSADTALSGRLDTLEADPTTATDLSTETAARIAGDALKLDLAGGSMSGDIVMAVEASTVAQPTVTKTSTSFGPYSIYSGDTGQLIHSITVVADGSYTNSNFKGIFINGGFRGGAETAGSWDTTEGITAPDNAFDDNQSSYSVFAAGTYTWTFDTPVNTGSTDVLAQFRRLSVTVNLVGGGGGTTATIGIDGSASFSGNVTASAVPSDNAHLVNKLYADNLVAGVDLSGIATNAAAIEALTNGAPELLNTLNELAEAIGDDENFATTVTNQISAETTARTNADTALSGRLDTLEADPTTQSLLDAETTARQNADALLMPKAGGTFTGAISGPAPTADSHLATKKFAEDLVAGIDLSQIETNRLDIAAETSARTSADTALSNRLDTLEADPTTATALSAETTARTSADTALSNRLDTLEADPTTQTLLSAEAASRVAADSALSGRLDTLEADPTTQTLLTAEETARIAGDALKLDLAGGTMTGDIVMGGGAAAPVGQGEFQVTASHSALWQIFEGSGSMTSIAVENHLGSMGEVRYILVDGQQLDVSGSFDVFPGDEAFDQAYGPDNFADGEDSRTRIRKAAVFTFDTPVEVTQNVQFYGRRFKAEVFLGGAGGTAATIGADGTASFNGNITSAAVPSDDAHLVNKLYADNLVAGVDLSGIATNAAAIEALTNGAPDLLNTLNELADAIGDDENFATTVTNQISSESTARTNADNALSARLNTLEADPTTQSALTSETASRINADNALSGRLDTLEADPTTATALAAETTARTNADNALSGRLDTLEADSTTQSLLDAETTARTNADTALSGRLDTLEADPTTGSALAAEATTRANADTALSGRLDTLEADPTTATAVTNAIAVETAARQAADDLKLDLAGGTMTGNILFGGAGGSTELLNLDFSDASQASYFTSNNGSTHTVSNGYAELTKAPGSWQASGIVFDTVIGQEYTIVADFERVGSSWRRAYVEPISNWAGANANPNSGTQSSRYEWTVTFTATETQHVFWVGGGGTVSRLYDFVLTTEGAATTAAINVDGSATFSGLVSAETVPTADAHLVNKLYADNLVAGVDLSGIATNAAAIQALTNGAPELLNTLQELAAALGDDANFSTTVTGQIAANEVHIDNVATLSGVAKDSTNLGAFTGSTISDTSNIKAALQALETAIETPSTASQIQTVEQTANGTFHVTFVDSNNGSATAESLFTDGGLTYNPFTDLLSGGSVDMTKFFFNGTEVTATGNELNFLGGVTSSVQTQLDGKVTTGANINALVGDTVAGDVPVDVNGTDNYLFLVIDKANGALTAIDKTFLEAE